MVGRVVRDPAKHREARRERRTTGEPHPSEIPEQVRERQRRWRDGLPAESRERRRLANREQMSKPTACPECGKRLTSPRVLGNPDVAVARIAEVEEILRDAVEPGAPFAPEE